MQKLFRSSFFIFIILTMFVFTSSCGFEKRKNSDEAFPDIEFSYNLVDWNKTIVYDGAPISLTLEINNNEAEAEFGIMLFINGIIQKFTTKECNENTYMQNYNIKSKQQKTIEMSFEPQNVTVGNYELVIIMMLNPTFMANAPNYVFGYNHKISYAYTNIQINTGANLYFNELAIEKTNFIDATEKNSYTNENSISNLAARAYCIMLKDSKEENRKINLKGNDLNIEYKVLGGSSAKYRITIFLNHEPILVDGKYKCVLLNSSVDTYSMFSCKYENKKMQKENIIYSIAIPIDNIKDNAFPIKSDSVVIIK